MDVCRVAAEAGLGEGGRLLDHALAPANLVAFDHLLASRTFARPGHLESGL